MLVIFGTPIESYSNDRTNCILNEYPKMLSERKKPLLGAKGKSQIGGKKIACNAEKPQNCFSHFVVQTLYS